jgi:hypothetical protein
VPTRRAPRGVTQRITAADIAAGRIRIPIGDVTKELFPQKPAQVSIVLKGRSLGDRPYDPRYGPDRERSGVIRVPSTILSSAVFEDERLPVVRDRNGTFFIGDRGSKLRIAEWVNDRAPELNRSLLAASPTLRDFVGRHKIEWLSPLRRDGNRELADDLWARLDWRALDPTAQGFWPRGQPNWDAVALLTGPIGIPGLILLEAKSHTAELRSACAAKGDARQTIERSLAQTKSYLGVPRAIDWTRPYYQAANRFAFLYHLRARCNIPTWLVFVYFVGDSLDVNGAPQDCPQAEEGWGASLAQMHDSLGLPVCHPLSPFSHEVFLEASTSHR